MSAAAITVDQIVSVAAKYGVTLVSVAAIAVHQIVSVAAVYICSLQL